MRLFSARSLQLQLALRLAALYVAATAIVVAVLIYQAYSTADTLTDEDLNRRAEEIAGFVTINDSGEPRLDLPPQTCGGLRRVGGDISLRCAGRGWSGHRCLVS